MAKSISRRVSAEETTIQQQNEPSQSQYECPICIYWLNEPVLTSCGHRFCKKCISSWLKKQNPSCPIDNMQLSESDLFPDNYTRREIQQIRQLCPNADFGCEVTASPLELDGHTMHCTFRKDRSQKHECHFTSVGCEFKATNPADIETHSQTEMSTHLNLLTNAFINQKQKNVEIGATNWDPPTKSTSSLSEGGGSAGIDGNNALLKALYERIVILEQQNHEKDVKIDKLAQQLATVSITDFGGNNMVHARYSGGVLVWKINQFQHKIESMKKDPNVMYYSTEAYTSPYGYRYCVRINISPKLREFIGLHVHLMKSNNDFHLDWPFRGRIKISMIHRNLNETKNDIMMTKPEILAFHRPNQEISPRGFGFLEYASINHILAKGFVISDTLTIKVQLSIV